MEWLGALQFKSLPLLDKALIKCTNCPRLVEWREDVAITKRKSYQNETYWGKPVPGFGPSNAKIVLVGLAPGAHGANRTGRIFTGDSSGDWLYKALYKNGLAKIPTSTSINDGQELFGVRITCAVHCAPPDNKPSTEEKHECSNWFTKEIELLLPTAQSFLALGSLAWNSTFNALKLLECAMPSTRPKFSHGASFNFTDNKGKKCKMFGSYHPSQQNTFTGKLTEKMLNDVIAKVKRSA
jgi:uracil-DNA glycosylase family 4